MTTGRRGPAPEPAAVKRAKGNPGRRPIDTEAQERAAAQAMEDQVLAEAAANTPAAAGGGQEGAGFPAGAGFSDFPSDGAGGGGGSDGGDEPPASAVPAIPPPDWLNAGGRVVWDRLAPRLATMKILQHIDADTFGRYCVNFARWIDLMRDIDTRGTTYESSSPHGEYIRANPSCALAMRLDRDLMMQEANFALNPADRQRLFAARAAAAGAGAGGADLFGGSSDGDGGKPVPKDHGGERHSPVGFLQ